MPLHREEITPRCLNSLDDAVVRATYDAEPFTDLVNRLVVQRVHAKTHAQQGA